MGSGLTVPVNRIPMRFVPFVNAFLESGINMLLQKLTPRKTADISKEMILYSNSATAVTMELLTPDNSHYHLTLTEVDLLRLLLILERRKEEIKKEMNT